MVPKHSIAEISMRLLVTATPILLAGSLAALATLAPDAAHATDAGRPNIIVILADDQGYGDFSCHGNPVLKTPNLDRLHREGVRFTDFHVSPTCSPTRCADDRPT